MNFTREPIIETVISAREGNKLKLTSTKMNSSKEYLVYAIEVVSFGQALFYRSGEPGNVFFIPMQDYEIEQVRQARMILKTPEDKAIKIAGGDQNKAKNADKNKKTEKPKRVSPKEEKPKKVVKKTLKASDDKHVDAQDPAKKIDIKDDLKEKVETTDEQVKKAPVKTKTTRRGTRKPLRKTASTTADRSEQTPSLFSHLLRPPEGLISDSIGKYLTNDNSGEKKVPVNVAKDSESEMSGDPNLASEAPKPFETLEEKPKSLEEKSKSLEEKPKSLESVKKAETIEAQKEIEPLSLKDRMKKVLSSGSKKSSDES